ncbi:hypothetical protein F5Y12DRAFT_663552 [Xylaria sp. FL1777]|nr:hypothetical protein F5Y12DRAFT_663552 [Xylaria sp. FL1777]
MGASAMAHDGFRHQQLSDPKNYFRLLRVTKCVPETTFQQQQESGDSDLECELTTWLIGDAPPYRSVSYTWGDPKHTTWIRVNGKRMQVRQNCKDVLQQIHQHTGADRYIWVDAICINQADHHEKNIQVAAMGAIYQKADIVLACLGAHDEYSRALVQNIKQNSELFKQASTYYSVPKPERKPNRAIKWRVRNWHVRQNPDQLVRMFFEFLCRPYFQRVWTYPEMRSARSVEILCGDDSVPASALSGLSLLVARGLDHYRDIDEETIDDVFDNPFSMRHLPEAIKMGVVFLSSQKVVRQTPLSRLFPLWHAAYSLEQEGHEHLNQLDFDGSQGRLNHGHLWAMTMDNSLRDPLWDALQFTLKLQCEKPRDRVYAVLAIVDWSSGAGETIQPDYSGDMYDLVKAILPWVCSMHGSASPDAKTSFAQCRSIIDALQLDTQTSPKLAPSIELRRRINIEQRRSETITDSLPTISVVGFRGFQVLSDEGILRLDVPMHWAKKHEKAYSVECCLLPTKNKWTAKTDQEHDEKMVKALTERIPEQFHVVFDKHDRMRSLLPHNAQAGDWIIADIEASATLVLREQANRRFHVIGEAVVDLSFIHCLSEVGTNFITTFDIDDFIALCAHKKETPYLFYDKIEDFLITLGNGVCYAPGSSYAVKHDD